MKKLILSVAIMIGLLSPAVAESGIEIKGFKTGMEWKNKENRVEWLEKDPMFEHRRLDLTVGGHDVVSIQLRPNLERSRVASLYFKLDSIAYDDVKSAIQTKYELECDNSIEQNLAGANFKNEECWVMLNGDTMYIERYAGNINDMSIYLLNDKDFDETYKAKKAKKLSDI